MRIMAVTVVVVGLMAPGCCWADPVDVPADSWTEYDLIVDVDMPVIDGQGEIQFMNDGGTQGYGLAATVHVLRALKLPADTNTWTIIIPSYWISEGVKNTAYPYVEKLAGTIHHTVACKWNPDHSLMVLREILPENIWDRYEHQIQSGATNVGSSTAAELTLRQSQEQEIPQAAEKIREYLKQLESGAITEEEYQQYTEPYQKILQQPRTDTVE